MKELHDQFLIEARELVERASDDLLALERTPGDAGRIDGAFRALHTLKGSVGLFDLAPMGVALHAAEELIGAVRDGRLVADRATIDVLLDCVGATDFWIEAFARTGTLPPNAGIEAQTLADSLHRPLAVGHSAAAAVVSDADWLVGLLARNEADVDKAHAAGLALTGVRYVPVADCFFLGDDPLALVRSVPDLVALHVSGRTPWSRDDFDPFACNLVIEALSAAPLDTISGLFRLVADQVTIAPATVAIGDVVQDVAASTVDTQESGARILRVDAGRVDAMLDIVGELIVAKNGLAHLITQAATAAPSLAKALRASHSEIERLVGDMHRAVMGARMIPLSQAVGRLPRLVRATASQLGRQVVFSVHGADVEADKAIVDGLYEPLLHVVRNAVDHGIETPEARVAAGKPAAGRIDLQVARDGDHIVVAVSDDGVGIDPAQLRQVAAARGLLDAAAIDALDDTAILDLVFAPGFSTAAAVTSISGRGVGMDAVRMAVQALGGRASIESRLGVGSTVRLTLPQVVAITTIIIVRAGEERFGIPIDVVAETARIPVEHILPVRDGAAFVLRDRTIPLLQLTDLLHVAKPPRAALHAKVLVVAVGEERVGVEVDAFADQSDVLLRPLTGLLSGMPGLLGAALLGDGKVLMVLDLPGLIG